MNEHPGLGKGLGRLQARVAIVTDANSGMGRTTARPFACEGVKVGRVLRYPGDGKSMSGQPDRTGWRTGALLAH